MRFIPLLLLLTPKFVLSIATSTFQPPPQTQPSLPPSPTTIGDLSGASVECFDPPSSPFEDSLPQVIGQDCGVALRSMIDVEKATAPLLFSRTKGFILPYRWTWNTCVIVADVVPPELELRASLLQVGEVVVDILTNCVKNNDHPEYLELGGKAYWRRRQGDGAMSNIMALRLFVIGKIPPRNYRQEAASLSVIF